MEATFTKDRMTKFKILTESVEKKEENLAALQSKGSELAAKFLDYLSKQGIMIHNSGFAIFNFNFEIALKANYSDRYETGEIQILDKAGEPNRPVAFYGFNIAGELVPSNHGDNSFYYLYAEVLEYIDQRNSVTTLSSFL